MLGGPTQVERPTVHDQHHDRCPGRDHRLQQLQLAAWELERRPRGQLADHVLPLAHDDDRDVGSVGEIDGALELGLLVERGGILDGVPVHPVER